MLFLDLKTRFVVANEPDKEGKLVSQDGVWTGILPPEESVANTAYTWQGVRWTMLSWPPPGDKYARTRLFMHECFHRIQEAVGLPGANPANSHLDTKDGRTWLRLEWRALAEALIRRDEARRRVVRDALIFRAYRQSIFPQAAAQERALELNEGLAEYTGYKLSGWPEWILADRAAVRLDQEERGSSIVRAFAYASGPAYGFLLDEAGAPWRKRLDARSDLGSALAEALGIPLPGGDLGNASREAAASYGGPAVIAEEEARAEIQRQAIARHRARFVDGPMLILPLTGNLRYTFSPQTAEALGELGTVYLSTRVTDAWGVLEASKGALLSRNQEGRMAEARVPAPSDVSGRRLTGDGWTLTLNEGWKVTARARPGDYSVIREK